MDIRSILFAVCRESLFVYFDIEDGDIVSTVGSRQDTIGPDHPPVGAESTPDSLSDSTSSTVTIGLVKGTAPTPVSSSCLRRP